MPKKDVERTNAAHKARQMHGKSYWGHDGHEYLERGGIDRKKRRHDLFLRCRGICFVCGNFAPEDGYPGFHGELHHVGCYCLGCIEWRCGQLMRDCHVRKSGFRKTAEAQRAVAEIVEVENA